MFAAARRVVRSCLGSVSASRAAVRAAFGAVCACLVFLAMSLPVLAGDPVPTPTPSASPAPNASASAYRGLGANAAATLAQERFAGVIGRKPPAPPDLAHATSVAAHSAIVPRGGGRNALVISRLPLRSSIGTGASRPVDLSWKQAAGGFALANPPHAVRAGAHAGDGAGFSDDGVMIAPAGVANAAAAKVGSTIFFAGVGPDADYFVQPAGAGLESSFLLRSADSPERLELAFRLRPGLALRKPASGLNSAEIVEGGKVVAVTGPVSAVDSNGTPVAATTSVEGSSLVISVPHRGLGLRYPILIDPSTYLFSDNIDVWTYADDGVKAWDHGGLWLGAPFQSELWEPGDFSELTYTPPGSAYVTRFSGSFYWESLYMHVFTQPVVGIRRANGNWESTAVWSSFGSGADPEPAINDGDQEHCVVADCQAPAAADAPTGQLAYFSGDRAVVRLEVTEEQDHGREGATLTMSDYSLELSDPDNPTLTGIVASPSGWLRTGTLTASGTGVDAGLGVKYFDLMQGSSVLATNTRTCTPETGDCASNWAGSVDAAVSSLPEGSTTLGVRARDVVDHVSSTSTFPVKVDRTVPAVALSGPATDPHNPGTSLTIGTDDGSASIDRSGVAKLHVKVDGVAKPDITVPCPSGLCPRTDSRAFVLAPGDYSEGSHVVSVTAEDLAGNVSTAVNATVYVVDLAAIDRSKLGLEDYFTYESTDTGVDTAAHVNVANGNLVWHWTPIQDPGRGLSTILNLTYNSQDRGGYLNSLIGESPFIGDSFADLLGVAYHEAGPGFSVGISGVTRLNEPLAGVQGVGSSNPAQIKLTDADGTLHVFARDDAPGRAGWYVAPAGVHLALRRVDEAAEKTWAATRPDGVKFYFDSDGYQTYAVDRNGNTITFVYELYPKVAGGTCSGTPLARYLCSKHVVQVLDAAGASLEITYENESTLPDMGSSPPSGLVGPVGGGERISQIRDGASRGEHVGNNLLFTYDEDGYLVSVLVNHPSFHECGGGCSEDRFVVFGYSGSGPNRVLSSVTDPRGNATTFTYESCDDPGASGAHSVGPRIASVTDRRPSTTSFSYATSPTRMTVTRPGSVHATYATDTAGRTTSITEDVTTAVQRVTALTWDTANNLHQYQRAAGTTQAATTTLEYDGLGDLLSLTDPNNHVITLTYGYGTEAGTTLGGSGYVRDLMTVRRPNDADTSVPATVTFTVDTHGNVTSRKYGDLHAATIHYPATNLGLPDYEDDEVGNRTTFSDYDDHGFPQTIADPRGGTWQYRFNGAGDLVTVTDPRGSATDPWTPYTTSFEYDRFSQPISTSEPKLSAGSSPEFLTRELSYDPNGNLLTATPRGSDPATYTYDAMDEVASTATEPVGHAGESGDAAEVTTYDYDSRGNLALVTTPKGVATSSTAGDYATAYAYDALDRVLTQTQQSRGGETKDLVTAYSYDLRDNIIGISDPKRVAAAAGGTPALRWAYGYDAADNRTSTVEDPAGLALTSITTYDANDNVSDVVSPRGFGLTGADQGAFTTHYDYDVRDLVTRVVSGGTATWSDSDTRVTRYERRDDGLLASVTAPKGVSTTSRDYDYRTSYTYDANDDVSTITLPPRDPTDADTVSTITYTRGPTGDPTTIHDPRGTPIVNTFYDTGDLHTTTRPSWFKLTLGDENEVTERDPSEWNLFDGSSVPKTPGTGDLGAVKGSGLPDVMPGAGKVTFNYDGQMRLAQMLDDDPTTTPIEALETNLTRSLDRVTTLTQPFHGSVRTVQHFGFDRNGNLATAEDGEGFVSTTDYDQFDRWLTRTMPGANETAPDPVNDPEDPDPLAGHAVPNVAHATWDDNGNQITSVDPRGKTSTMHYDAVDRLGYVKDPLDHQTDLGYDKNGNQTCMRTPRGHDSTACADGDPDYVTSSEHNRFDELLRVTRHATFGGGDQTLLTSYTYDRDGNTVEITSPGAERASGGSMPEQVVDQTFDGRDALKSTTAGALSSGHDDRTTTAYEYDQIGNLRRVVDPKGLAGGEPTLPDNGDSTPTSDATKNATVFVTDADNMAIDRWLPWDDDDRPAPADPPRKLRQHFERDGFGRVERIDAPHTTSDDSNTTRVKYEYFDNGWISHATDAYWDTGDNAWHDRPSASYEYDLRGNQTEWTISGATDVTREYWPNGLLGRRHAIKGPKDPTSRDYSYGYTPNDDIAQVRDGNLKDTHDHDRITQSAYDDASRLSSVDETWANGKDSEFHYNPDDQLTERRSDGAQSNDFASGKWTRFVYDSIGREREMRVWRGDPDDSSPIRTQTTTYWHSGDARTISRSNVDETHYFDTQGRIVHRDRDRSGGTPEPQDYEYDPNGNRNKDEHGTYEFNARAQMSKWTQSGTTSTYTLDGLGAVKTVTNPSGEQRYTSRGDRLKTVETLSGSTVTDTKYYRFDNATGAMTCADSSSDSSSGCAGGTSFDYDDYNRLKDTETSGGAAQHTTTAYDGLDRRETSCTFSVSSGSCGSSTKQHDYGYLGLSEQLSSDTNTSSSDKHTYDYTSQGQRVGADLESSSGNDTRSYFTDPNGSVLGLEQESGAISDSGTLGNEHYSYGPYGSENESSLGAVAADNPFRFQGFAVDPDTSVYDMQARPYRPNIERFTTPDRFEDALGDFALQADPLTEGRYGFGAGNPVNTIEFDGHDPITTYNPNGQQKLVDKNGTCFRDCQEPTGSVAPPPVKGTNTYAPWSQRRADPAPPSGHLTDSSSGGGYRNKKSHFKLPPGGVCLTNPGGGCAGEAFPPPPPGTVGDWAACTVHSFTFGWVHPPANHNTGACQLGELTGAVAGGGVVDASAHGAVRLGGKVLEKKLAGGAARGGADLAAGGVDIAGGGADVTGAGADIAGGGSGVFAGGTELVPRGAHSLGKWGEARLADVLGNAGYKPRRPLITPSGARRYPDRLVGGVSHEAKAGVDVELTTGVRKQIDRDAELIASGQIRGAHWHFFQGAKQDVLDYLNSRGIPSTVYP